VNNSLDEAEAEERRLREPESVAHAGNEIKIIISIMLNSYFKSIPKKSILFDRIGYEFYKIHCLCRL